MKGDFSRWTFDPKKHYSAVLMQQGRLQLDSDWNEQQISNLYRAVTAIKDQVGRCGAPKDCDGFRIVVKVADLTQTELARSGNSPQPDLTPKVDFYITAGRYYVDGILCENEQIVPFTKQPSPYHIQAMEKDESYLLYLDIWSRHITALDDQQIREVALGGPDTTTRSKDDKALASIGAELSM